MTLAPLPRGLQLWNSKRTDPPPEGVCTVVAAPMDQLTWARLQPTRDGDLDVSLIEQTIAYAQKKRPSGEPYSKFVSVRMFAGHGAPQWLMDEAGSFPYFNPQGQTLDEAKPCLRFWEQSAIDAYERLNRKLAARYDEHETVVCVYNALPMTRFAEPMMRGIASPENRAAMVAAGYTFEKDWAAHMAALDIHRREWRRVRLGIGINPWQDPAANKTRVDQTIKWLDECRKRLGHQAIVQNNSIRESFMNDPPTSNYARLYAAMQDHARRGYAIGWQSAGADAIGDPVRVAEWVASMGGVLFESFPELLPGDKRWPVAEKLASNADLYPTTEEQVERLRAAVAAITSDRDAAVQARDLAVSERDVAVRERSEALALAAAQGNAFTELRAVCDAVYAAMQPYERMKAAEASAETTS